MGKTDAQCSGLSEVPRGQPPFYFSPTRLESLRYCGKSLRNDLDRWEEFHYLAEADRAGFGQEGERVPYPPTVIVGGHTGVGRYTGKYVMRQDRIIHD